MAESSLIGKNIEYLRNLRGLSQKALADQARVSQSLIARLETGTRQDLQCGPALRIAKVLRVNLDDLCRFRIQFQRQKDI